MALIYKAHRAVIFMIAQHSCCHSQLKPTVVNKGAKKGKMFCRTSATRGLLLCDTS